MQRPTIALTLALVLVTGSASAVIWQQHKRIAELNARSLQAESTTSELREKLAAVPAAPPPRAEEETTEEPQVAFNPNPADGDNPAPPRGRWEANRSRGAARFAELLADPEVASLLLSQRKAGLDSRYAALFKRLGLSPQEVDKFKDLLAERQMSRMETGAVARAEGMGRGDRDEIRDLMQQSDAESDAQLQALLGADRYNTYKNYEETATQRSQVNQFANRLSYTATPLQDYQSNALVQMLATNPAPQMPSRNATPEDMDNYLNALEDYNTQIYSRSSSILSPDQLSALQEMQKEVTDRAKLGVIMRRRVGRPPGG